MFHWYQYLGFDKKKNKTTTTKPLRKLEMNRLFYALCTLVKICARRSVIIAACAPTVKLYQINKVKLSVPAYRIILLCKIS